MKITIIGRKCTPRDSFKERAEKKLAKVERFFGEDTEAKITATVEKNEKIVEITVNSGGLIFRAQERSQDLDEALDRCVDSLIRQIRKNKTKVEKKLRKEVLDDFIVPNEPDIVEETDYDLVRTKEIPMKPLLADEAILQMNMLGHKFFMFLNAETNLINVVYVRKDGGYGLLVPDEK